MLKFIIRIRKGKINRENQRTEKNEQPFRGKSQPLPGRGN